MFREDEGVEAAVSAAPRPWEPGPAFLRIDMLSIRFRSWAVRDTDASRMGKSSQSGPWQ